MGEQASGRRGDPHDSGQGRDGSLIGVWSAAGAALSAFVLGLVGWHTADPNMGCAQVVYSTLSMFTLNFSHEGPIPGSLEVARFLAAGVAFSAAFAVVWKVVRGGSALRKVQRWRRHVVIIGSAPEVRPIAANYRSDGRKVAVVGELSPTTAEHLVRQSVELIPTPSPRQLGRIVNNAVRVIVVGRDDGAASELASRVREGERATRIRRAWKTPASLTVLLDDAEYAARWAQATSDSVVCRSTRLATVLLRSYPPFLETAMVPAPVVIGDGAAATEIVRRIVTGWQQPGESVTVHCLGHDPVWATAAGKGLDKRVNLPYVAVDPHPTEAAAAVAAIVASWPRPEGADRYLIEGPTVYVAYPDLVTTVNITSAVADRLDGARVVGLVDNEANWVETFTPAAAKVVSRLSILSDPASLELDPAQLLADELVADAGRWPHEVPSAFGQIVPASPGSSGAATLAKQEPDVRSAIVAVAGQVEEILGAGGVHLERRDWGTDATFLFAPDQLLAVAAALEHLLAPAQDRDGREPQLRLLELAARLPILAARSGWMPRPEAGEGTTSQPTLTTEDLRTMAVVAHQAYEQVSALTHNATDSENYGRRWAELSEVDQRSNIAQVADIPVKLATLGLTWRPADESRAVTFTFAQDEVEQLAENEHRRWAHFELRNGRAGHVWNVPWEELADDAKEYDRSAVRKIPLILASVGLDIVPL